METEIKKMESLTAKRIFILSMIAEYESKGLGNCQNVVQLKNELEQIHFDKYKKKYPAYLFFSDEQFDEIVKRNNLVISNIEAYTGYIPDNCFEAVKNENINKEDFRKNHYRCKCVFEYNDSNHNRIELTVNMNEYEYGSVKISDSNSAAKFIVSKGGYSDWNQFARKLYGSKFCREYENLSEGLYETTLTIENATYFRYDGIHIACPNQMIDESKRRRPTILERFKIIKQQQPTDPIIFRYIKDGILVITFWE